MYASSSPDSSSCRPFTGAWIETADYVRKHQTNLSRPFTGAWIETKVML